MKKAKKAAKPQIKKPLSRRVQYPAKFQKPNTAKLERAFKKEIDKVTKSIIGRGPLPKGRPVQVRTLTVYSMGEVVANWIWGANCASWVCGGGTIIIHTDEERIRYRGFVCVERTPNDSI